jgi:REP element-mobilizing transposase RayT
MPEPPHSAALRRGRCSEPGRVYLIATTTAARQPVFMDFDLARATIAEMRHCDSLGRGQTLAFVLMPDRMHWLVQLQSGALSKLVASFKANSAKTVNRPRGSPGVKLWQTGFHDHALRRDEDLASVARYIVANPMRAGLVSHVGDYPHWDAVWI